MTFDIEPPMNCRDNEKKLVLAMKEKGLETHMSRSADDRNHKDRESGEGV